MGNEQENETPGLEFKCVSIAGFKALDGEEDGVVESLVSVTGVVDNVRDVIEPGAYTKSLEVRTPKGVWHHDWKESVSKTLAIKELMPGDPELPEFLPNGRPWPDGAGALKVKTQFNLGTQRGREAYSDVMFFGDQQEWSIGYNVPVGGASRNQKSGVRTIHRLDLYEYSPVLFGAMPAARTSSVKEAQLAYKSLMGEVTTDDDTETKAEVFGTDGSERVYGYLEDGMFTKAQVTVSSTQAKKIHKVINSLVELLRETNVVDDDEEVGGMAVNDSSGGEQQAAGNAEAGGEEAGNGTGASVSELINELFADDNSVLELADDFDTAVEEQDIDTLEEVIGDILDAVDVATEDGREMSEFADLSDAIQAVMQEAESWEPAEEEPEEESDDEEVTDEEEPTEDEEKSDINKTETKSITLDELRIVLDS